MSSSDTKEEKMLEAVEDCIRDLTSLFLTTRYLFYRESDLHCYFFKMLLKRLEGPGFKPYETKDNKLTNLIHREYPTKKRYNKEELKETDDKGARRGHFDVCIWNPEEVNRRLFRNRGSNEIKDQQQTYFAFEFIFTEGKAESTVHEVYEHIRWDVLKLKDNEVKYGYILFFARDWSSASRMYGNELLDRLKKHKKSSNTTLIYVERSNGRKLKERFTLSPSIIRAKF
jgi:hypothetical protein